MGSVYGRPQVKTSNVPSVTAPTPSLTVIFVERYGFYFGVAKTYSLKIVIPSEQSKKETLKSTKKKTNKPVFKQVTEELNKTTDNYMNNWSTCVSPPNEAHLATSYVTQKQDDASQDSVRLHLTRVTYNCDRFCRTRKKAR